MKQFIITILSGVFLFSLVSCTNEVTTTGYHNGHTYVDLGLPSGTLWSTTNIGATSPEQYGWHFAWGDKDPQTSQYKSNKTNYDTAAKNWGGNWKMPKLADFDELLTYCTWSISRYKGVTGYKFVSKQNDNIIFFPFAGDLVSAKSHVFIEGRYWSASMDSNGIHPIALHLLHVPDIHSSTRTCGFTIRPVLSPQ